MARLKVLLTWGFFAVSVGHATAGPAIFLNDYEGFLAAAGNVRLIDFETLPDGNPSRVGVHITPDFNYTDQGVTFSSPRGILFISGNPVSGFGLMADAYYEQETTWIIATLSQPVFALGFFGPGAEFLSIYDRNGSLLAVATPPDNNPDWFVGFVSDIEIARAVADLGDTVAVISAFAITPIPEPVTILLLAAGMIVFARRRSA